MSGGIGLSAADADKATTAATTAKAPFRKTSFGEKTPFETNLGKSSTFKYPLRSRRRNMADPAPD
jgi:hypothetical protein